LIIVAYFLPGQLFWATNHWGQVICFVFVFYCLFWVVHTSASDWKNLSPK